MREASDWVAGLSCTRGCKFFAPFSSVSPQWGGHAVPAVASVGRRVVDIAFLAAIAVFLMLALALVAGCAALERMK